MESNKTKQILQEKNIDYFILPNNDEFGSEYLPKNAKRIEFLTGFDGSNATIIFKKSGKNAFFTDGRYTLQASKQLNKKEFEIFDLSQKTILKYLVENIKKDQNIALDPKLHSAKQAKLIQGHIEAKQANFITLKENLVDKIWTKQPEITQSPIFLFADKFAGQKTAIKIKNSLEKIDNKADALFLNFPPAINWLLNIRGSDIDFTPLKLGYCLLCKNGKIDLFLDNLELDKKVQKYFFKNNINVIARKDLKNHLQKHKNSIKNIQIDGSYLNFEVYSLINQLKITIIDKSDPILALKSIKNKVEIKNNIKSHEIDGLAVTKFLFWLSKNEKTDELTASQKLLEFRQENNDFIYPSFETISGFGSNGAVIHYRVTEKTNKKFSKNNLYLVDSGGQYLQGTTDITRTILIGNKAKKEYIANFTRVLKGHIALARAKFPIGTKGSDLDILARNFLWQDFKDYAHGTGHGVGQFLSVHESPPNISKRTDNQALLPGMTLSNEPGYYENGQYGIRIENLMLVTTTKNKDFLQFQTLSLAPIEPKLINFKMLTYPEKKWLKEYHNKIYQKFAKKLNLEARNWLKNINLVYQNLIK